jgi:predicted methyltransferase
MKKIVLLAVAIAAGATQLAFADDGLKAAIAATQRTPANVARDNARHPFETLRFFGIKPGMTVVELSPGGGWYTEILAPYLRQDGKLIAGISDPASASDYGRRSYSSFKKKLDANPAVYDKVALGIFEPPAKLDYAAKNSVDMVVTFRNIHNWVPSGDASMKALFQNVFSVLKSGGVFGIVEHRLPATQAQDAQTSTGYVHEAFVIKLAQSAGFTLAASSEINANPKDKADHENGVWALPPVLANKDKDRTKYQEIGESDRMTLKFVKP